MKNCEPIVGLVLDRKSQAALQRINRKPMLGSALASTISGGVLANIFANNRPPQAAFSISQTDWTLYARSMRAIPAITKRAMEKEVELMVLHYQTHFDRKLLKFWEGLYSGCQ